jgi:hypothetical protein
MGRVILETGHIPARSIVSYTAVNEPLVAHAWLSEVIFASLFSIGGLALLTVATGILVAATHASIALFLRNRGADPRWALGAAFISLAVSSTHWLTRPHMFSIAGAALTLFLLETKSRKRLALFAVLFAVWANLHGGWLFGLLMIAIYVTGNLAEAALARERRAEWMQLARGNAAALAIASLVTLLNPFGLALHREVLSGATSATLAKQMGEFMSPDFQAAAPLPFLAALLVSVALLAVLKKRMPLPHLILVVVSLFLALRSFRNMALFGVSAWPLIALHASNAWPAGRRKFPLFNEIARLDAGSRVGLYAAPVALILILIGLNSGSVFGAQLIRSEFSNAKFPVAAVAKARAAGLNDRIFEAWEWGGYIMYAWPEARLLVDPLKFNDATTEAFAKIDAVRPGWQQEIDRWNIKTVIIHPKSPLAETLAIDPGWKLWYSDSTAVIFRPLTIDP